MAFFSCYNWLVIFCWAHVLDDDCLTDNMKIENHIEEGGPIGEEVEEKKDERVNVSPCRQRKLGNRSLSLL